MKGITVSPWVYTRQRYLRLPSSHRLVLFTRIETEIKTTPNSEVTTRLGPFMICCFRFTETSERIEERYLTVDEMSGLFQTIQLDVDTQATVNASAFPRCGHSSEYLPSELDVGGGPY